MGRPVVVAGGQANGIRDEPEPGPGRDAAPGSVLAQLRERAHAERAARTLDVPLGGIWQGALVIRYGMPSQAEADRIMNASARFAGVTDGPTMGSSTLAVDVMNTCCRTVLGSAGGRTEDLDCRLDGQLWELLELPLPAGVDDPGELTVADVVGGLFDGNWLAVGAHAAKVMVWLQREGDEPGEA